MSDQLNKKSFYLTEQPDNKLIKNIFRHPDIHDDDRKRFRKYCDSVKNGKITIQYSKKCKYGRYYPVDGSLISATYMWRKVRSSLFRDTEYDIDIKSAHFQIMINEVNDFVSLDKLQELINNREEFFKLFYIKYDAITLYNNNNKTDYTKKDIIKKLLTRILYGGLLDNWYKEFDFTSDDVSIPTWFYEVNEEIRQGINIIKVKYQDLLKDMKNELLQKEKEEWDLQQENRKDKRKKPIPFDMDNHNIPLRQLLAMFFQEKESIIIDNIYDFIKKTYNIRPTAYCYDGLQFLKSDIANVNEFIESINETTNVVFEVKPFDDCLSNCKEYKESCYFDYDEFNTISDENKQVEYFNKYYFKIHSLNGMCYINDKGALCNIKNETSHFAIIYDFWEAIKFTNKIKTYYSCAMYPNNELCPDKVYNLWKGFEIENYECDELVDIDTILYHFQVVANFDDKVYNYLLDYFAHLIQKPHIKTGVCLLIQGLQGTGKTTLVEILLKKIMGKRYVYDTADVDKIVGKFNSSIAGKLMVVLNEATARDTKDVVDKIKDIITRTDATIELKGVDPFEVEDYCNYCFTTNNIKPVCITSDDRRFQVIECSDKYKQDTIYFNKLYACLNDTKVIYSCYKFFKKRDISKFHPERDRVVTEATIDLQELNRDPIDLFLEYIHSNDYDKYENVMKTRDVYNEYRSYSSSIGFHNVCALPVFGKVIKKYENKYNFSIFKPHNVSSIKFDWENKCHIED